MMNKGVLYLCATPIGNLEDITLRALRVLKEADLVAAEDTRRTRKLFSHYDIHTPLTSYHDHNRGGKGPYLIAQLFEGKNIALVTDAGLPGISDPGQEITLLAIAADIRVVPIPGPSASLSALVVSGFPSDKFCFEGFLSSKGSVRRLELEALKREKRTMILYEAPHRLLSTLKDISSIYGDRQICVARELTKHFEEIWYGSAIEGVEKFTQVPPKGEITLVIRGFQGSPEEERVYSNMDLIQMVKGLEEKGLTRKDALKEIAKASGRPKREIYSLLVEEKRESIE
jgi:16S rRNA (cytidine1402-2'-O)-methyltransferase